ncbi:GDSL Lipase/Acylhydrolase family protein [Penicillium herquei]|nr:GDSL Lipase/Acylhydrolase family protein [Penicillium herquei]
MSNTEDMGKPYDQFILFGDSITQMSNDMQLGFGLQPALQDAYSRKLDVINRGFGGYNTDHALNVLPRFFPSPEVANVRFMTIFFGANDSCVPGQSQHIPIPQFKENLKALAKHPAVLAQGPDLRIIFITPPPVNEYQLEGFDNGKNYNHPSRTAALAKAYGEAVKEVGTDLGIPTADIWTSFMTSVGWGEGQPLIGSRDLPQNDAFAALFVDGLHLTGAGYRLVFAEVLKVIEANWPAQSPSALPMVYPAWNAFDL